MSCADCTTAEANPRSARYTRDCDECRARAFANSPEYFDSARAEAMTPAYRSALQLTFGANWKHAHTRVRFHSDRIHAAGKG